MRTVLIALSLIASPAMADLTCAPRDDVVSILQDDYQTQQVFAGLSSNGRIVEIWANAGLWVLIVSMPNGIACIAEVGVASHMLPVGVPA